MSTNPIHESYFINDFRLTEWYHIAVLHWVSEDKTSYNLSIFWDGLEVITGASPGPKDTLNTLKWSFLLLFRIS